MIKVAAAHDVGKAINPAIVEGQIEGGVLMGGLRLSEEILHDAKGSAAAQQPAQVHAPTAEDVPEIDAIVVE